MAFCSSCGAQNADGVNFCNACGKPVTGGAAAQPLPATEKVGNIRKCPSCGQVVESFQSRCSSCQHEFTTVKTASSVKEFFDRITSINAEASTVPPPKKSKWKLTVAIIGLLVLGTTWASLGILPGFILSCLIMILVSWGIHFRKVAFSQNENEAKNLIENFPIPNAREDLLEFLILASSKVEDAHGFSYTARKQQAWNKIWARKCDQLKTKVSLAFAGDPQSLATAKNLQDKTEKVIAQTKKRTTIFGAVILAALIATPVLALALRPSIPEPRTLQPEDIHFSGFFSGFYQVAGVQLAVEENGRTLALTLDVQAMRSFNDYLENRVNETTRLWGWEDDNVSYELSSGSRVRFAGQTCSRPATRAAIADMLRMDAGETRRVWFRLSSDRDSSITAMGMTVLPLSIELDYILTNHSRSFSDGGGRRLSDPIIFR